MNSVIKDANICGIFWNANTTKLLFWNLTADEKHYSLLKLQSVLRNTLANSNIGSKLQPPGMAFRFFNGFGFKWLQRPQIVVIPTADIVHCNPIEVAECSFQCTFLTLARQYHWKTSHSVNSMNTWLCIRDLGNVAFCSVVWPNIKASIAYLLRHPAEDYSWATTSVSMATSSCFLKCWFVQFFQEQCRIGFRCVSIKAAYLISISSRSYQLRF